MRKAEAILTGKRGMLLTHATSKLGLFRDLTNVGRFEPIADCPMDFDSRIDVAIQSEITVESHYGIKRVVLHGLGQ
jgi:hypothetical protein